MHTVHVHLKVAKAIDQSYASSTSNDKNSEWMRLL